MKKLYMLMLVLSLIPAIGCRPKFTESNQLVPAIMVYDARSVLYILAHGADPNKAENENSDIPIYTAVTMVTDSNTPEKKKTAEDILRLIIKYGGDINKRNSSSGGITMLHFAKNIETVRLLVELGADVNAADIKYGNTPLHTWITVFKSDLKMYQYLLEHGADVNKKNNSGKTVIDYANDKKLKDSEVEDVRELYNILQQYRLNKS